MTRHSLPLPYCPEIHLWEISSILNQTPKLSSAPEPRILTVQYFLLTITYNNVLLDIIKEYELNLSRVLFPKAFLLSKNFS